MATITARQQRRLQRSFHLLAAATLLYYVYVPAAHSVHDLVRFVAFPVLALTGLAMWQAARLRRAVRWFAKGGGSGDHERRSAKIRPRTVQRVAGSIVPVLAVDDGSRVPAPARSAHGSLVVARW